MALRSVRLCVIAFLAPLSLVSLAPAAADRYHYSAESPLINFGHRYEVYQYEVHIDLIRYENEEWSEHRTRFSWRFGDADSGTETLVVADELNNDYLATTAVVVVSDSKLTSQQYQAALRAWECGRADFKYLRLTCTGGEITPPDVRVHRDGGRCVCARFERQRNASSGCIGDWNAWPRYVDLSAWEVLPPLARETFSGLSGLRVLDISSATLSPLEVSTFDDLTSLELVRLSDVTFLPTSTTGLQNIFCGMRHSLRTVDFHNVGGLSMESIFGAPSGNAEVCGVDTRENWLLNLGVIWLRHCGLTNITSKTFSLTSPSSLLSANVTRNQIEFISDDALIGYKRLLVLDLSHNKITSVTEAMFKPLTSLKRLHLSFNRLRSMPVGGIFKHFSTLNLLELSNNEIGSVDGVFTNSTRIQFLMLSRNNVSVIPDGSFANCTKLVVVDLHGNKITEMSERVFADTRVAYLDLSHNAICNATGLRQALVGSNAVYINLADNCLNDLVADMFSQPCQKIEETCRFTAFVIFTGNVIQTVDPAAFRNQTQLQGIYLNENRIMELPSQVFSNLSQLTMLNLSHNALCILPDDIFESNADVEILEISWNALVVLPQSLMKLQKLKVLILNNNRLSTLPLVNAPSSIQFRHLMCIILEENNFREIRNNSFAMFPNLMILLFGENVIRSMEPGCFFANPLLSNIALSHNPLDFRPENSYFGIQIPVILALYVQNISIDPGVYLFSGDLGRTQNLILDHNRIVELVNPPRRSTTDQNNPAGPAIVTYLSLRNCSIRAIADRALADAYILQTLDLFGNELTEFKPFNIGSRLAYTVKLEENPIRCSCRMKWLKGGQFAKFYSLQYCQHALTGKSVVLNEVRAEEFVCKLDICVSDQPACDCYAENELAPDAPTLVSCSNKGIERFPGRLHSSVKIIYFDGNRLGSITRYDFQTPHPNVTELYLDRNYISSIDEGSFGNVSGLVVLGLSGNRLTCIDKGTFSKLRYLKTVRLDGNLLETIDPLAFRDLHDITSLTLHNNLLVELDAKLLDEIDLNNRYLTNITLSENPWSCPCDNATFKNWIQSHADVILNTVDIRCNDTSILTLPDEHFICYDQRRHIFVKDFLIGPLTAVTFIFLLVLAALALLYGYRHRVQVIVYTRFGLRLGRKENAVCPWDAFICYDTDNQAIYDWVDNVFTARLSEMDERLRIKTYDDLAFTAGSNVIGDSINAAVQKSKRTILVLDNTPPDPYTILAFNIAYDKMTNSDRTHDIMLVFMEDFDRARFVNESVIGGERTRASSHTSSRESS